MAKLTYKKIKNFLNETEINLLSTYCKLRSRFPSNENISWNSPDKPSNFKFKGDYCANVFLHYVRKDGVYKNFKYDQRINIGARWK